MAFTGDPAAKHVVFRNVWSGATLRISIGGSEGAQAVERMRDLMSWVVARR